MLNRSASAGSDISVPIMPMHSFERPPGCLRSMGKILTQNDHSSCFKRKSVHSALLFLQSLFLLVGLQSPLASALFGRHIAVEALALNHCLAGCAVTKSSVPSAVCITLFVIHALFRLHEPGARSAHAPSFDATRACFPCRRRGVEKGPACLRRV